MYWFSGLIWQFNPNLPAMSTTGYAYVPDGFLSLGVEQFFGENLRLCYEIWEQEKFPISS
ncbi:hypothetical protein [Nostoc sphaeroides]|uniref:Endonuclease n=1 Tax=Nostoc sphaeroides CCNUC1 TaxID=2653204 RepID=A0A5P8VZJ3_9NOSO|nr:hypothetical protein [Nostoc sphaeroides]MCC5630061.1 hypothetical protein [Nostoc sphaeroides CHAB 2801]QFS45817.1 Endonuclease [Nostoc sphaeroides CCNUC1]